MTKKIGINKKTSITISNSVFEEQIEEYIFY